jgi:hypothetical protein
MSEFPFQGAGESSDSPRHLFAKHFQLDAVGISEAISLRVDQWSVPKLQLAEFDQRHRKCHVTENAGE